MPAFSIARSRFWACSSYAVPSVPDGQALGYIDGIGNPSNIVGSHIGDVVVCEVVMEESPGRLVVEVGLHQIEGVSEDVQRDHVLGVELDHVEGRVLAHIGGQGPCVEVQAYVFISADALRHLDVLVMRVAVKVYAYDVLKPVHETTVSVPPPVYTLICSGNMSDDDGLTSRTLEGQQLCFKPLQLVSWVVPVFQEEPVVYVAGLSVQANDHCVTQLCPVL